MGEPHEQEPRQGDSIYVTGHGPAIIVEELPSDKGRASADNQTYKVVYPNGATDNVAKSQILVRESLGGEVTSNGGSFSRGSSPRMASRQILGSSPSAAQVGPRRLEYLGRAFDDEGRNIGTGSATFSLVATMVGGGVLSLPYAMSQCGIALGLMALAVSAAASCWTLDMLVDCARCTGRDTFELIGHAAYGEAGRKVTIVLIFAICWLALVAYSVLIGDLLVPIAELAFPELPHSLGSPEALRRLTICVATLFLSPMCFKSGLNALSFLCFASVGSVVIVGMVIAYRAALHVGVEHEIRILNPKQEIVPITVSGAFNWFPEQWSQALYVVPMFGVSFMCHFNALPTHQELARPTRTRMRRVLLLCMAFTSLLYTFVGISGYLYAGSYTCGNILLNFDGKDPLLVFTRGVLALVLMLNYPLICQPARNALFRVLSGCKCFSPEPLENGAIAATASTDGAVESTRGGSGTSLQAGSSLSGSAELDAEMDLVITGVSDDPAADQLQQRKASADTANPDDKRSPMMGPSSPASSSRMPPSSPKASPTRVHVYYRETVEGHMARGASVEALDSYLPKDETVQQGSAAPSPLQRYCLTAGVLMSSLTLACLLKSVLVVWSILGSSVCFMVGFILPASFWRRIMGPFVSGRARLASGSLAGFIGVLAVVCTVQALLKLDAPACPPVEIEGISDASAFNHEANRWMPLVARIVDSLPAGSPLTQF